MSHKTGLPSVVIPITLSLILLQDVSWIYASPDNTRNKSYYVANLYCYNNIVQQF